VTATLVLLHGFGTSRHVWDSAVPHLDRPVLPLDLPGFGANTSDARSSVDGMADAVLEQVQAAGLQNFVLVGHSMGAKVAAVLAGRRPAGLSGLLLIAPSPPSPEPMTDQDRADLKAGYGHPELLRSHYGEITRQPLSPTVMDQLLSDGVRGSQAAWNAWPDVGSLEHREGDVRAIAVPIWLLTSADDPVISPGVVSETVLPAYPLAGHTVLQGSGHLLPLELPREVAAFVKSALNAEPSPRASQGE
jgi:pimeloyl-ACP methyl ester carboxylesterase